MRKYLIICFLLLTSIALEAKDLLEIKFSAIEQEKYHRQEAIKALKEADSMCWYIPDFGKREHMHAIIASAIPAAVIPNPKTKLLSVGLALIGSLAIDMYDQFCVYRSALTRASYHLEMVFVYNALSRKFSERASQDLGIQAFLRAIDCLTLCDMLSYTIDSAITCGSGDEGNGINVRIRALRHSLIEEANNSKWKLTKEVCQLGRAFYENLDEILSECNDNELRSKIYYNVREVVIHLEAAERSNTGKSQVFLGKLG